MKVLETQLHATPNFQSSLKFGVLTQNLVLSGKSRVGYNRMLYSPPQSVGVSQEASDRKR